MPTEQGQSVMYEHPDVGVYMPLNPSTMSWEINRQQVKIDKIIGKGTFSVVAKAIVFNIRGIENSATVAVKMLKGEFDFHFLLMAQLNVCELLNTI